jgi:hypothetical protein
MSIQPDDKRLTYLKESEAVVPPSGLIEHIKDHWFPVHPEHGIIFFSGSIQGNRSEHLARRFSSRLYPWAEIKFFPSVFRRINPNDYVDK